MDKLITVTPPEKVTDEYKNEAKTWTKWDSKSRKKFTYNYTAEERVLILDGSAELSPDDGSPTVVIGKGDRVTFHKGFKCKWKITKRMKKHYTVVQDEDEEEDAPPAITCDVCDADCSAESYFMDEDERDICPTCYEKGKDGEYAGAEHQKEGEEWVEPEKEKKAPPKKKQKTAKK
mmetsp:Transcript_23470/g.50835  ORF Transcript_23470/g.50835 Transcript_23470/m.50835 type:complete len:176 (+) Transcript_23470:118-645(+)|eukprot:CAMPEP_0172297452 /NCGR_PEP_ID=MMETSP1058-20130122/470_1 /TAXON_ID=83371 /ORGANISM="Detonula confervacea, Strain CCMP 353" /LENGTH=175 /DNA_ID=CAMNT_0013006609 /DNA_START=100 /DNA_END=627 /DNA_ORIENTATION=-